MRSPILPNVAGLVFKAEAYTPTKKALTAPYTMVLKVRVDKPLYRNAVRTRPGESVFEHAGLLEVLIAFNAMK